MKLRYLEASEDDFDALVELRIDAMRESLERIGRFNRERSIERFRSSFVAADIMRASRSRDIAGLRLCAMIDASELRRCSAI